MYELYDSNLGENMRFYKSLIRNIIIASIGLILLCSAAVAQQAAYPPEIVAALDSAKTNRPQIERVLNHYAESGDSLKYKAACFLIANMEGHCYATYALRDTLDQEVAWDIFDYDGYGPMFADWELTINTQICNRR
jgi:hypothetical protein